MTKTLTEQWREGTLKEGFYYILFASRFGEDYITIDMFISDEKDFMYSCCEDVKEVLAPVPSYDKVKEMSQKIERLEFDNEALDNELKELATKNDTLAMENGRLKERLEIATKALKEYAITETHDWIDSQAFAKKALKEMEGVK